MRGTGTTATTGATGAGPAPKPPGERPVASALASVGSILAGANPPQGQ
jgi:hypothetical protein